MDKLIIKYFSNKASEEEIAFLFQWIQASPQNKSLFIKIKKAWVLTASIDNQLEWTEIQEKIQFKKENQLNLEQVINDHKPKIKRLNRIKPLLKYVAVIILMLVFGDSYFKNTSNVEMAPINIIQSATVVNAGTDRATLTLADGLTVVLEKGKSFSDKNVISNGERLIYGSTKEEVYAIEYNYLTVPRGGQFFVELQDGTQVWLNSESQLKYPVTFLEGVPRSVELVYGEAYFDVSPSTEHNGDVFKVLTGKQKIEVIGTEFNVKAYQDDEHVYTTLVEGKVVLDNSIQSNDLIPGQQSILNKETSDVKIAKVNVASEISWRDGVFSFRGKTLKEIMKVLSRWYDVNILFHNNELQEIKYIGVLSKNQKLEEILTIIKNTKFINAYEIKDNAILIK
ncbi:FecR domain-containing protein [uncultured Wocania sp.]|uniref:FecR family protein n=1 Tax=uncultured Wocania sp. TaxID=2834404 RepID=UPI0030F7D4EA